MDRISFRRLANEVARKQWGNPDSSRTIIPGRAMSFGTPSHGGEVVCLTAAELSEFPKGSWREGAVFDVRSGDPELSAMGHPQLEHLVAFEEDCDWCLPVLFLPNYAKAVTESKLWPGLKTEEEVISVAKEMYQNHRLGYFEPTVPQVEISL